MVSRRSCAVGLLALVLCVSACSSGGGKNTTATTTTAIQSRVASEPSDRYVPPTHLEGGIAVLPVTLPDGDTLSLRYPPAMRIAQLGFSGVINVRWPVSRGVTACCGQFVTINFTTAAQIYGNAKPIAVYPGLNGRHLPLFNLPQNSQGGPAIHGQSLAFQFGLWLVQVETFRRLTNAEYATWARDLTGTVDSDGYLVLHARAPLSIGNQFDGGFGVSYGPAEVRLTSHSTDLPAHLVCNHAAPGKSVRLRTQFYGGTVGVAWCVGNDLHVSATGTSTFVDLAAKHLQVAPLVRPRVNDPRISP